MKSWFGSYVLHGHEPFEVTVLANQQQLTIGYIDEQHRPVSIAWKLRDASATFDASRQATALSCHTDPGARLFIGGREPLEWIEAGQAEDRKPWYRKEKAKDRGRYGLFVGGILGSLVVAYLLLVPWMAEKMADQVSVETEQGFGDSIYEAIVGPAQVDSASTALVNEFFQAMKVATPYTIRITVVHSGEVNAFALPGGRMVVYTALLHRLNSYPELAALLSHEFTHVNNRHTTRSVFRKLGSRIFTGLLFGNFGKVTSVMVDQADGLKSLTYSRKLEKEADLQGLELLKERKIDPRGFGDLFARLKTAGEGRDLPELLASHPDIENRVAYVREAAKGAEVEENVELKTIFDELKSEQP